MGLAGLAVASGAAVAVGFGAGPAVGQSSTPIQAQIQVNSPATLVAKGAGVDVSVTISCSATAQSAFLVVGLTESVKKSIAYGFGDDSTITCTGEGQTIELLVLAGSTGPSGIPGGPSKAFAKGEAIANATLNACTAEGSCASAQTEPIIKIS